MNVFDLTATLSLDAQEFFSGLQQAYEAVTEFISVAVETGSAFDSSMAKVRAVTGDFKGDIDELIAAADAMGLAYETGLTDTETAFNIIRAKALQSSAETKFTAEETAEALVYMGMAGWKVADMFEGLDAVMALAAASGEDVGRTSDIITDALTAFGKDAGEAEHLADVLATAAANANTNVKMMGESFKYAAPLAGAMGYSFEDVSLALGLMANAGVKSGRAGRAINNMLVRMADPTEKVQTQLQELGISLSDAAGNTYSFREWMENLRESVGGLRDVQNDVRPFAQWFQENFSDIYAEQGLSNAEVYNDLLSGRIDILEAYQRVLEDLGEDAFDEDMQERFLNAANALTENGLEKLLKIANVLGGKQALPALLALINSTEEDFYGLAEAIDKSTGAAEKMQDTMLDNLAGDLAIFNSNLDILRISISDKLTPIYRDFVRVSTTSIEKITAAVKAGDYVGAGQWIIITARQFANMAREYLPEIKKIGSTLVSTITAILHSPTIRETIGEAVSMVFGWVEQFFSDNLDVIIDFMTLNYRAFVPMIKGVVRGLGNVIKENLPDIIQYVLEGAEEVIAAIEAAWPEIEIELKRLFVKLYNGLDIGSKLSDLGIIGQLVGPALQKWANQWETDVQHADFAKAHEGDVSEAVGYYLSAIEGARSLIGGMTDSNYADTLSKLATLFTSDFVENYNRFSSQGVGFDESFVGALRALMPMINEFIQFSEDGTATLIDMDSENAQAQLKTILDLLGNLEQYATTGISVNVNFMETFGEDGDMSDWIGGFGNKSKINNARSMWGGSILRGATLFGMDAQGRPLSGGESGPEAVVGVSSLSQMIQASVNQAVGGVASALAGGSQPVTIQLVLDSGEIVSIVETEIARNVQWKAGGRA